MKNALVVGLLFLAQQSFAGPVNYYNQVEMPTTSQQVHLVDAEYVLLPTRTATRAIPGCNPNSEAGPVCDETVVLESEAVVRANIGYRDSMFSSEGNQLSYTSVIFKLADFSAQEVAALKSVYPSWKHPLSSLQRDFAKSQLVLSISVRLNNSWVKRVAR